MILKQWQPGRLWFADMIRKQWGLSTIHRMVVIRLGNGALVIHNPIELSTQLQAELSSLGRVQSVVTASPTYHHHLSDWWLAYSDALFYATPTLMQKRSDLNFDAALSSHAPGAWKGELYQTTLLGSSQSRKIAFCDPKSTTLLLSDHLLAVQPHQPTGQKCLTWCQGINKTLELPYRDRRQDRDMARLRASVQQVMTWPFDRLLASNGLIIESEAKHAFYQAFWWAF